MMGDQLLATRNDLEARIGALSDAQAARVAGLLADASAEVRSVTGQQITHVESGIATIRPNGRRIRLPQRPVTAVASVSDAVTGVALPTSAWSWDGIDAVQLTVGVGLAASYRVEYSHGYHTVPPVVVGLVCGAVNRVLTASALLDGVTSESIGQYSVQTPGGNSGVQVRFTHREEKRLRSRFGRGSTTVRTGGG